MTQNTPTKLRLPPREAAGAVQEEAKQGQQQEDLQQEQQAQEQGQAQQEQEQEQEQNTAQESPVAAEVAGDQAQVGPDPVIVLKEQPLVYPTYEAGRLTQFFTNDGTCIKPEAGIYTARTQEQFDLLNYYAAQQAGLVTPLF